MKNNNYVSKIASKLHVSESELAMLYPDYSASWNEEKVKKALWELGLNSNLDFEFQQASQHRNRANKIVTCGRFYGYEREDIEWIKSGFASQAVKDKLKNSRILDDLYRAKGLTEDCIEAAEWKDKYSECKE